MEGGREEDTIVRPLLSEEIILTQKQQKEKIHESTKKGRGDEDQYSATAEEV